VLPGETKNYVPIILAMTIISKNPARYGLDTVTPEPPLQYDVVKVNYPVDLRLVAECVDAPVDTLVDLNPSLLRRTTPKDQPYDLRIPAGSKEKYEAAIASIPEDKRVAWRYYKVQAGDSLSAVAHKYHSTEKAIAQANNLQGSTLAPETKLVIPISASTAGAGRIAYSRYPSRYKAHSGDTVQSVAEDFGVPADRLRRWNRLKGNELRRGRVVLVYKPLGPGDPDRRPVSHHRKAVHKSHKTPVSKSAATPAKESLAASSR
jgi:membrane-bound lytic murein transglycosylase D